MNASTLRLRWKANRSKPIRQRPLLLGAIALSVVILLVGIAAFSTGIFAWRRVNRIHLGTSSTTTANKSKNALTTTGSTVPKGVISVLIASVGARGVDQTTGKKLGVPDIAARGSDGLTDLLMEGLVNTTTGSVSLLSIPRDTWIHSCQCKINALYNMYGPTRLVDEVTNLTGERPQHLLLVNFEAFANVIDAVGGVNVYLPRTIRDTDAHLVQLDAGCQHLNGVVALAYVRSRHTQSLRNGVWVDDASASDFGRIERQRQVLSNLAVRILSPALPFRLPALVKAAGNGVTIDDTLGLSDAVAIAKAVASASSHQLRGFTLPSRFGRVGDASVVLTQLDQVPEVVVRWRASAQQPVVSGPTIPANPSSTDALTASGAWSTNTTTGKPNPDATACANS